MKFLKNNKMLEIFEAEPKDAEEILEYLKIVGGETINLLFDGKGMRMTIEQEKAYLENIKSNPASGVFIGRIEGEIVSMCGMHNMPRERIKHNVEVGITVKKDFWNLGIGRHMMEFAINYARVSKIIKNILLEVRTDNEYAIKLYKDLGFKEVGRYQDRFFVEGKYCDSIIMQMQI